MTKRRREPRERATHIRDFLAGNPAATQCLQQQGRADGLLERVRGLLAPTARAHCIQARVNAGEMTVTVDSAAWATRLRYQAPDLAQGLADAGVTRVKVHARPRAPERPPNPRPRQARHRPAVADHLMAAAAGMADAELAELFRRLARRHQEGGPGAAGPDGPTA